jgi:16S rRNA (adenine1518-N6/adenine1519-N6)-dimethyltransferase
MLGPMPSTAAPDYDSPTALRALLEAEGLAMSKRFGQNFLINRRQRERILEELKAAPGSLAWEIGPGIGAMTAIALASSLRVAAFEIDHGFARLLARLFGNDPSFSLVEGDFIDMWEGELAAAGRPDRIFGNLPYNAANAIVASLIEGGLLPDRMVFTVQKEAAQRMAAVPGTKDYSAFSVLCTSACRVRIAFDVGSSSFWPAPKVVSSVVALEPRPRPILPDDRLGFSAFVRSGFSSRRKTLRNNLRAAGRAYGDELSDALRAVGAAEDARAEALCPEELASVYSALARAAGPGAGPARPRPLPISGA